MPTSLARRCHGGGRSSIPEGAANNSSAQDYFQPCLARPPAARFWLRLGLLRMGCLHLRLCSDHQPCRTCQSLYPACWRVSRHHNRSAVHQRQLHRRPDLRHPNGWWFCGPHHRAHDSDGSHRGSSVYADTRCYLTDVLLYNAETTGAASFCPGGVWTRIMSLRIGAGGGQDHLRTQSSLDLTVDGFLGESFGGGDDYIVIGVRPSTLTTVTIRNALTVPGAPERCLSPRSPEQTLTPCG